MSNKKVNPVLTNYLGREIGTLDSAEKMISIDSIESHPLNGEYFSVEADAERIKELAGSIMVNGLMHNIVVKIKPGSEKGKYVVISGNRRLAAYRLLREQGAEGFDKIRSQVVRFDSEDEENLYFVHANTTQRQLKPQQLYRLAQLAAESYKKMKEEDNPKLQGVWMREYLAESLHINEKWAGMLVDLEEKIPDVLFDEFNKGNIGMSRLNDLVSLPKKKQETIAQQVVETEEGGKQFVEELIKSEKEKKSSGADVPKMKSLTSSSVGKSIDKFLDGLMQKIDDHGLKSRVQKISALARQEFDLD